MSPWFLLPHLGGATSPPPGSGGGQLRSLPAVRTVAVVDNLSLGQTEGLSLPLADINLQNTRIKKKHFRQIKWDLTMGDNKGWSKKIRLSKVNVGGWWVEWLLRQSDWMDFNLHWNPFDFLFKNVHSLWYLTWRFSTLMTVWGEWLRNLKIQK